MLGRYRSDHPELAQLVFRPGTILGESVDNPITAIFDRPVVVGVRGSDAPFVLVWDEDVARCIVEGIRQRRTGIYNLAGDGAITLRRDRPADRQALRGVPVPVLRAALRILQAAPAELGSARSRSDSCATGRCSPTIGSEADFDDTPTATTEECFERYRRCTGSR